jgi:two-component system, response regulator
MQAMMRARHILVVEDADEDYQTVLESAKNCTAPNDIQRVTSGEACLRVLRDLADRRQALPALVLLDLNTPQSDGREALLQIKQDVRLREIPIVVLNGSANPRDLSFCYANGANAYHVKPVHHALHLLVLQKVFDYWLINVVSPFETTYAP